MSWRSQTLGEVVTLKRGYDLPKRERSDGPYPVVSSSGIIGFHDEAKAHGPGVVTGRYGTLGEVHYIEQDFWPLNTALYVADFKGNDSRFISYSLQTLNFQAHSDKAAVPGINRNHLHQESVRIPAVEEQRAIGSFLGRLDDKIDLNRRMSQTLEEIAQTLFRAWFENLREIDCQSIALSKIADLEKSSARPLENPDELWEHYSIPAFDADRRPIFEPGRDIKSTKYRVPKEAILVSKLNPRFPRVWRVDVENQSAAVCSTEFMPFVPTTEWPRAFVYEFLKSEAFQTRLQAMSSGSTGSRQRVKPTEVVDLDISVPKDRNRVGKFAEIAEPLHRRVQLNIDQSQTLAQLRDLLLPKLISGEFRIPDAEALIEETV